MSDTSFELELTAMAHGGSALGRHEGRAIFVPYAIPGERIRARVTRDRKSYAEAEILDLLAQSPARVQPRCRHFGSCGGCHWQHIDYEAQLVLKRQVVIDQLARIGGLRDVIVHPTIASPDPWGYRSHASFHATSDGRLGFVAPDGRTVIALEECHIIRPELLAMFHAMPSQDLKRDERLRLQVGSDGNERLAAILRVDDRRSGDDAPVSTSGQTFARTGAVHYTIKGRTFRVTAGSFFQVNLSQTETLVDLVIERLALTGSERALDLYSGVGLFAAFLAERAGHVTSVEGFPLAVRDARANLARLDNVRLVEGAVEHALSRLDPVYDAVVTDPPRSGMDANTLEALVKRAPTKIVYVSCDPATLARDARRLVDAGYALIDVQPVDMFPQTYHVESVATFVKAG